MSRCSEDAHLLQCYSSMYFVDRNGEVVLDALDLSVPKTSSYKEAGDLVKADCEILPHALELIANIIIIVLSPPFLFQ